MKRRIDLKKAAEAEAFGALALGKTRKHRNRGTGAGQMFTPAQGRAFSDLARSLVQIAREAGAEHRRIKVRGVSFELQEHGVEEVLSIRTATGS
jgi:hypothetical protein